MAKRISERQRLLTYAMTADKEQIEEALDIFKTALASRFEKKERKKKADYKDRPTSANPNNARVMPVAEAAKGSAA